MSQALISILMPVKNAEPFLKVCIESIIEQDYKNWELLAVNDHSVDATSLILSNFEKLDSRIKVFQNKGKGIIPALRLAFSNSRGSFTTRMDADDLMSTDKLRSMQQVLNNSGKGHLVIGLVKYISESTLGDGYKKYENWLNELTLKENNWEEIYKECVVPSPCWMLFKEDLHNAGAFDSSFYPEDYDLCFRLRNSGLKIKKIPKLLHYWRDHESRSSRTDPNYADNRFLDLKLHHFMKSDYNNSEPLILWGAGKKGKYIANYFIEHEMPFLWISNNKNKIGHDIYGQIVKPVTHLSAVQNSQLIIAIAATGIEEEISSSLSKLPKAVISEVFKFC